VGRRGVFPPQVRAQVTAIAGSLPCQQQVPLSRWSRAELARRVAQDRSLPRISASTVGRWLKAERIRPWRYHAWQHIHDPHVFLQRARPVLQAYAQARALLRAGTWLLCLDEKTSIQAREGEQPPRPARPGKPLLHEARYHRRGARHLFAGLSVADGEVYGTCRQRKCFVDFQAFVQQHIIPEALRRRVHTVTLILDNGTTHAPKQLEGWLRGQERACDQRLHFQVLWLPTNARLSGSNRNLVQCTATETFAAQSFCQHKGTRNLSQHVYRLLQSGCQTHQLDLYRREAGTQTRKAVMIACTKRDILSCSCVLNCLRF
jgi:DDE superfamily endonuclease